MVTLKVHDRNREGLNQYVQITFLHSTIYLNREENMFTTD